MPLTNPYNPYTPYTSYLPNQFQTSTPNSTYRTPQYPPATNAASLENLAQQQNPVVPIFGRVIATESEIKPNEVPMDGSIALFPVSDFSVIIAKQWSQDGTIKTVKFAPEIQTMESEKTASVSISELAHSMDERFNKIESMLKYRNGGRSNQKAETKGSSDE
jgi:hypothetical protein